jgi:hypothetical protein
METAGACFERCPGQAPAEVLMLRQLEVAAAWIVAQSAITSGGRVAGPVVLVSDGAAKIVDSLQAARSRSNGLRMIWMPK